MKRLLFYCVVLVITFSQFGCNRLSEDINGNCLYMQYLVQSQNHDALLVNIAYTEKAEIGYVEQYYRLDLQNYNTETISYLKGRQLNLLKSKYEAFDIDNFIATNAPDNDPRETEIGLFHSSYVPLIKDSSAGVMYDSVQDDRCVYCFDKDGMISDSVHIMNKDGTNQTTIPLPENTDITLSPDGKYVLCANTNGKNGKNGIIAFNKQTYIALSERLNLGVRSGLYNPLMEEFIVPLRNDTKGDSLYRVNADGEVKVFNVEK